MALGQLGGAVSRVAPDATAFNHRNVRYDFISAGVCADPAPATACIQWAREFWEAMQPFSTGGVYVNYLGQEADEGAERVQAAYGPAKYARLVAWVEDNIEETLTFYRLPRQHHKHLKSTNMLERLNEEIKRRTHVVRIFPNAESCLRLVRALCVETHENWLEAHRYLNMDYLRELKKEALRKAA